MSFQSEPGLRYHYHHSRLGRLRICQPSGSDAMAEPNEVRQLLEQIARHHDRLGTPLRKALRPGLDPHDLKRDLPFELHPDITEIFMWHDGLDWDKWHGSGSPALFPIYGSFLPFNNRADAALGMIDDLEHAGVEAPFWKRGWFPILGGGGLDEIVVDSDENSPSYGRVWFSSIEEMSSQYLADNVAALLRTVSHLFELDLFEYSIGGLTTAREVSSQEAKTWLAGEVPERG